MDTVFSKQAWDDYLYWQKQDPKILEKINTLINEAKRTPYSGTGKPKPLKDNWSGWWARRINHEHRMVYRILGNDEQIELAKLRYHY